MYDAVAKNRLKQYLAQRLQRVIVIYLSHVTRLQQEGDGKLALELVSCIVDMNHYDRTVLIQLALVYTAIGRLRDAFRVYEQLPSPEGDTAHVMFHRGFILKRLGRYAEALSALEAASCETTPYHAQALFQQGVTLRYMARHEEALARFRAAMEAGLDRLTGGVAEAVTLRELGDLETSLGVLESLGAKACPPDPAKASFKDLTLSAMWCLALHNARRVLRLVRSYPKGVYSDMTTRDGVLLFGLDVQDSISLAVCIDNRPSCPIAVCRGAQATKRSYKDTLRTALALAEHRVRNNGRDVEAHIREIALRNAIGEPETALDLIEQLAQSVTTDNRVVCLHALMLRYFGQFEEAECHLRAWIRREKRHLRRCCIWVSSFANVEGQTRPLTYSNPRNGCHRMIGWYGIIMPWP